MKIPPPVYLLAAAAVQHALAPDRPSGAGRKAAGTALAAAAVALDVSAAMEFRKHRTTVDPIHPDKASAVVETGPFRLTRNPMYVGMAALLTAHAVARGGWRTLLPVAGFVAVIDRVQIPAEEAALRARFGEAYDRYRRRVPRWVGPVGPATSATP